MQHLLNLSYLIKVKYRSYLNLVIFVHLNDTFNTLYDIYVLFWVMVWRLFQHNIGYAWRPVLMMEEEPDNPGKEPPTHEKLQARFLT